MKTILVTGAAGFIGAHVAAKLISQGHKVVGLDNFNDYYEVSLKHDRVHALISSQALSHNFTMEVGGLESAPFVNSVFDKHDIDIVIHLGAQAGVRYSIENPQAYIDSNVTGTLNIFSAAKQNNVDHVVYASSSSVYGNSKESTFKTDARADKPVSMYAATKRMNEMMAYVYEDMYDIPMTGLRFFTVYGPWGRPDMSPMIFAKAIANGDTLNLFNGGDHYRDFTYIDDIVNGILAIALSNKPSKDVRHVYNIGAGKPVHISEFVETMESAIGKKAKKNFLPMQPGDVYSTHACVEGLRNDFNYTPKMSVKEGVDRFLAWFDIYHS